MSKEADRIKSSYVPFWSYVLPGATGPHVMGPDDTDAAKVAPAPAWECRHCVQHNSGWATECGRCGYTKEANPPAPSLTTTTAKALTRIDDLEFALLRIYNALELGVPDMAKEIALAAIRKRWSEPLTKNQESTDSIK